MFSNPVAAELNRSLDSPYDKYPYTSRRFHSGRSSKFFEGDALWDLSIVLWTMDPFEDAAETDRLVRRARWEPLVPREDLEGVRCNGEMLFALLLRSLSAVAFLSSVGGLVCGVCCCLFLGLLNRGIRLAGFFAGVCFGVLGVAHGLVISGSCT